MQITVGLQENYSYTFLPLIVCIVAVVAVFAVLLMVTHKKQEKKIPKASQKAWSALTDSEKNRLRMKYFRILDELHGKVCSGQISLRHCYQKLSISVREFVSEMTGVKVSRCTLNDIRRMNMPVLAGLMEEFYTVEFAKVSVGDAEAAIAKTKRVIETWN
ncbi:MAG: hypothetical protein ACI4HQ_04360 [Acetatifactor sp.]